jgi:uncharacterized SAM-binding protein YcdF (DUF218 family)
MKAHDGILILSNLMSKTGYLNAESRLRADLGATLFKSNKARIIITSGYAYRKDSSLEIGNAVKNYLVSKHKIPEYLIAAELRSRDTVGDAYFTRINLIQEHKIKSLLVITSDYHLARTRKIFKFIYGDCCKLNFKVVPTSNFLSKIDKEKKSLITFNETFNGTPPGDIEKITISLFERHPLYLDFYNQNS